MSTPVSYAISPIAHAKAVLHAAKYPASTVFGVFLASSSSSTDPAKVDLVDAVPIAHHWTQLVAMTETALQQLAIHCQSTKQVIAGLYIANERSNDTQIHAHTVMLATQIRARFSDACVIVLDCSNSTLASSTLPQFLLYTTNKDGRWVTAGKTRQLEVAENERTTKLVGEVKALEAIADFDDHLEDVSQDWIRNDAVVQLLSS
ncbi:UPF0172-domain-containing protein [Ramicandelaber brevisporus]|nr:UPF0172-domain-containing protein [Ramicandelaber brevisporus]